MTRSYVSANTSESSMCDFHQQKQISFTFHTTCFFYQHFLHVFSQPKAISCEKVQLISSSWQLTQSSP